MEIDFLPPPKDIYLYILDWQGYIKWASEEPLGDQGMAVVGQKLWGFPDLRECFGKAITGESIMVQQTYSYSNGETLVWNLSFQGILLCSKCAVSMVASKRPASNTALTIREVEVLKNIADGQSVAEISSLTDLSESTVANHIASIKIKSGSTSRHLLVKFAIEYFYKFAF